MTFDELKAVGLDGMAYMILSLDRRLKDMTQECLLVHQQLTSLSTGHRTLLQERNEARAEVERLRKATENAFTLEQIRGTVQTAISEMASNATPLPRRSRRQKGKEP